MKKKALILLLILINISIIFYINFKIETDISYHSGKDGGIFSGFKMIILLSSIYFLVLTKHNKFIFFIIGFLIGIVSFLVSYFAVFWISNSSDIYFYLLAMLLFVLSFHLIEKHRTIVKLNAKN
ncbi:hypothetical protein IW18_13350 [Flavobacterium hibernum]|uniref:Uncharacterized protein n=1 Tax=Flavobacterium hibernum TaxID=37752 RepID=A0A0D0ETW0_9FLAO|nr:hypothetical protein IW18_13350 [Flavobacterium hibernum]OXA84154.1 hypothetical protein B0A73_20905 [Flavobacterium hibernum]STO11030.1 Uncharacterised protein [Flavobacterium hibernum]